jgi:beta-glucosidase-like glycosyl hydrolase
VLLSDPASLPSRWGRIQESVSEDPFLNGGYAAQFVAGFQGAGDGVGYTKAAACCKHFYAYSLEGSDGFTRHNFNAVVSKRDLHETFLPAFQTCVAAQPEQIMCSYNAVNGVRELPPMAKRHRRATIAMREQ